MAMTLPRPEFPIKRTALVDYYLTVILVVPHYLELIECRVDSYSGAASRVRLLYRYRRCQPRSYLEQLAFRNYNYMDGK